MNYFLESSDSKLDLLLWQMAAFWRVVSFGINI
jgi:hypothetical protein